VNGRLGVLTGYILGGGTMESSLIIDDILWDHLHIDEKQELLRRFLAQAHAGGGRKRLSHRCGTMPILSHLEPLVSEDQRAS
jgi:hypothetical protein